ncbi:endonuclease domain-containing protein [Phenylobacterium sp.]|uniref:endonuclease domain-containing protein n=1 Tax=Phenylobacterium sp. TaxID=1871053 RepID=UPI00391C07F7
MTSQVQRARAFRQAMSEPEVMLWARLKQLRAQGHHIRRQAPFRGYCLDFVCYARRLAIEVDGGQHGHDGQARHDAVRDQVLARHGFRVLRFATSDVRRDIGWVMDTIVQALEAAPPVSRQRRDPPSP